MTHNQSLAFIVSLAILVGICEISHAVVHNRPRYIQCQSDAECSLGHCCTISQNRFGIPQCQPLLEEGANCRPGEHQTLNTTLYYPDKSQVELTNVHVTLCPCIHGLSCDVTEGVCREPSQHSGFNSLLGESSIQED